MTIRTLTASFAMFLLTAMALAEPSPTPVSPFTESERELIELCDELKSAYFEFYARLDESAEGTERDAYYDANEPAARFVDRLIGFEREHRGSHAGLMAVRRLLSLSGSTLTEASRRGRKAAVEALPHYAARSELPEVLRYVSGRDPTGDVACLRAIIDAESATEINRTIAKLGLAKAILTIRDGRSSSLSRLREIDGSDSPADPDERARLRSHLEQTPSEERIARWEADALATLAWLAENAHEIRQPAIAYRDDGRYLIEIDEAKTASMRSVAEMAEGALFHERHLRVGQSAADLDLALLNGDRWSLAANRGKTVIVQFSFKGCGPCEAMYPELRSLQEDFGDRIAIVTVLSDEDRTDASEAVDSGKVTWPASWDGSRGLVATRWAVVAYPTVYIIDANGVVAADNLRGQALRDKVAELLR